MRLSTLAVAWTASVLLESAVAWPGMGKTLEELQTRQSDSSLDSDELIGDLAYTPDDQLTPVGKDVKAVITGKASGQSQQIYLFPVPPKGSSACKADTCCIWHYISNDMHAKFKGPSGRCTNLARAAIRAGFHDAATWSKFTGQGGGADGSLVLAPSEIARSENKGLEEIVQQFKQWYDTYKGYGVGMADLIQMAANVATVTCPLGPRVKSYVGRLDSSDPSPNDLLPDVNSDANTLIDLFEAKTIKPHGLTALIGAHTTSQQRFVDPARAGDPQDSTPGVWDVQFYKETLGSAPPRVFRFHSDIVLAQDPRISDEFQSFAGLGGQGRWNEDYAREYVRLSLLGVYKINQLTECTKVLPPVTLVYINPDQTLLTKWLSSIKNIPQVAQAVADGELLNIVERLINLLKKLSAKFSPARL